MNNQMVINLKSARRAMRIERLIDRLDDRGTVLIYKAIENHADRPLYESYMAAIEVVSNRCRKLAAYIDGLSRPNARRRSA